MNKYAPIQATIAYPSSNILGEGPVWHEERQSFLWVDIEGQSINEWKWLTKEVQTWPMPQKIGMAAVQNNNELIIALHDGLARFNLETAQLAWLTTIEKDIAGNRPNDGKCDALGRLWVGTMDMENKTGAGSLYCIDGNISVAKKIGNLTIPNGLAWSADNKQLYFIDSTTAKVDCYSFDLETATISFEKTVIRTPASMGLPDGMTIDEEGMLWIAHWDGFAVCRWNPHNGQLLDTIAIPVPQVSSCTFGGDDLDHLFITTAKTGLSEELLFKYPLSGHVFIAKCYVKGTTAKKFRFYQ